MWRFLSTELKEARFSADKHKKTVLLFSIVALGFSFSVLFAVLAPLGREVGLTEFQISTILAASSLTMFLASPRWGRLSDRVGRKRIMIIGLLGHVVVSLLFTSIFKLAMPGMLVPITAYLALMLARTLNAMLMSAIMPSANAYMADMTDESSRTKGMGAVGAANNLGAIIGPAGGGLLAGITLLTPLWTASVVALITAGFVYYLLPESPSAGSNRQEIESSKLSYFQFFLIENRNIVNPRSTCSTYLSRFCNQLFTFLGRRYKSNHVILSNCCLVVAIASKRKSTVCKRKNKPPMANIVTIKVFALNS